MKRKSKKLGLFRKEGSNLFKRKSIKNHLKIFFSGGGTHHPEQKVPLLSDNMRTGEKTRNILYNQLQYEKNEPEKEAIKNLEEQTVGKELIFEIPTAKDLKKNFKSAGYHGMYPKYVSEKFPNSVWYIVDNKVHRVDNKQRKKVEEPSLEDEMYYQEDVQMTFEDQMRDLDNISFLKKMWLMTYKGQKYLEKKLNKINERSDIDEKLKKEYIKKINEFLI